MCIRLFFKASSPLKASKTVYPLDLSILQVSFLSVSSSSTSRIVSEPFRFDETICVLLFSSFFPRVIGKNILNTVPLFNSLSTKINPLFCLMIPYTVDRPNPVPLPFALVVKKGSKIRFWISLSIPIPVSLTVIITKEPGGFFTP